MLQIHERIRQARLSAGFSAQEMADKIGVKRTTYQYWEEKTPGIDKILLVENALKLPKGYFLGNSAENVGTPVTRDEIADRLNLILESIVDLSNQQKMTRADVRAFGEYQVMKDAGGDEAVRRKIMAQINMLVGLNLGAGVERDTVLGTQGKD